MKKILMGAAVMAMFATSCQNEVVVNDVQSTGKGEFFTLEVGKGFESRTVLSGNATHWCEDDAIFVSGAGGKVSGVLTFESYVGDNKSQAKFSGWISGGQSDELEHIVFPVPQGGKIDMAKRDPNKLDAPMIGTIGNGAVQTLKNVGGLVNFDTKGDVYDVEAISGEDNMSGGSYTFDPVAGTLTYVPGDNLVPTYVDENGNAYVPVATTTDANDGSNNATLSNVTINVVKDEQIVASTKVNVTSGEIFGDEEDESTDALDVKVVKDATELVDAIQVGGYVKLSNSISVKERLYVNSGVTLTLDLNKNTLTGEGLNSSVLVNNGILILKNGTVTDKNANKNVPGLNNNGEAVLNCTIISNSSNAIQNNNTGKLTIEGGHYESTNPTDGQALRMNAWHGEDGAGAWELYINGGTFIGKWAGLYMAENYKNLSKGGIARIYNATFKGNPDVVATPKEGSNRNGGDIIFEAVKNVTIENCALETKSIHSLSVEEESEINGEPVETNENLYSTLFK